MGKLMEEGKSQKKCRSGIISKIVSFIVYRHSEKLNRCNPEIDYLGEKFVLLPEVYRPMHGEESILSQITCNDKVLDLGCGSGIITVLLARVAQNVVATDIGEKAVECTRRNLNLKGFTSVEVLQGNMFSTITSKFDKIIANPPWIYFVSEPSDDRAWGTSSSFIPELFTNAKHFLIEKPESRVYVFFPLQFRKVIEKQAIAKDFQLVSIHPHGPRPLRVRMKYGQIWLKPGWFEFKVK
jgi:predicted RNA methylase